MEKKYVKAGERVELVLPHSEVCIHMRVAGKRAMVELNTPPGRRHPISAQIYFRDGRKFSSPITIGEAGFYSEGHHGIYYYQPCGNEPWIGELVRRWIIELVMEDDSKEYIINPYSIERTKVEIDAYGFENHTAAARWIFGLDWLPHGVKSINIKPHNSN